MILAIPGSLRHGSINAARGLAVTIDDSPRALPYFNPDLEPFRIKALNARLADAFDLYSQLKHVHWTSRLWFVEAHLRA